MLAERRKWTLFLTHFIPFQRYLLSALNILVNCVGNLTKSEYYGQETFFTSPCLAIIGLSLDIQLIRVYLRESTKMTRVPKKTLIDTNVYMYKEGWLLNAIVYQTT